MSKKTNTFWFVLVATIFNLIITIVCFVILLLLYGMFLVPKLPPEAVPWGLLCIFIGSVALSFLIYRLALRLFMKKVDMEKYFDPIFGSRGRSLRR